MITLARIGLLGSLHELFDVVFISTEVYDEVVVSGAGLPGASAVSSADWIRVSAVGDVAALAAAVSKTGLGAGETSAVQLASDLGVQLVLMDERRGRRLAQEAGLTAVGCVGILKELCRRGSVTDLRQAYVALLRHSIRIGLRTLQNSLKQFNLPPL